MQVESSADTFDLHLAIVGLEDQFVVFLECIFLYIILSAQSTSFLQATSLEEFEFQPDPVTDYGVSCS